MAKNIALVIDVDDAQVQALLIKLGRLEKSLSGGRLQADLDAISTQLGLLKKESTLVSDAGKSMEQRLDASLKKIQQTVKQTAQSVGELQQATAAINVSDLQTLMASSSFNPPTVENSTLPEDSALKGKTDSAADYLNTFAQTMQAMDQLSEVQFQNELARIEAKRQQEIDAVNAQVIEEEAKQAKIAAINTKYEKEAAVAKKKAANQEKAMAITQAFISGALAVMRAIEQFGPPPSPLGIAGIAAAGVTTAAQVAVIAAKKFKRGGAIPFETGGAIQGPLHSRGGVPFVAGGRLMEAEGGELVVNRNIWSRPDFVRSISSMNAATGGRRFFAGGGVVPSVSVPPSVQRLGADSMEVSAELIAGLRGVIAEEVGSLRVVNNVVDTTTQQTSLLNQQVGSSF